MKDNFPDTEPVFMKDKPAEPVIEVAPGEYERCAVPAQVAPREPVIKSVRHVPGTIHGTNYGPPPNIAVGWLPGVNVPAEPQAGAQVPECAHQAQERTIYCVNCGEEGEVIWPAVK